MAKTTRTFWERFFGRIQLMFGFCPACNSSAPELYGCKVCEYYSTAGGKPFPLTKETKAIWWERFNK